MTYVVKIRVNLDTLIRTLAFKIDRFENLALARDSVKDFVLCQNKELRWIWNLHRIWWVLVSLWLKNNKYEKWWEMILNMDGPYPWSAKATGRWLNLSTLIKDKAEREIGPKAFLMIAWTDTRPLSLMAAVNRIMKVIK